MNFLEANVEDVRNLVREIKTYKKKKELISEALSEVRGGFSERNLRLFCAKHGIKRLTKAHVDDIDDMTSLT